MIGISIWDINRGYRYGIWDIDNDIDMGYGLSIWDLVYRYGHTPYRYGHPGHRYGISCHSDARPYPSVPSVSGEMRVKLPVFSPRCSGAS